MSLRRVLCAIAALAAVACGGKSTIPSPAVATDDSIPAPPVEPEPVRVDVIAGADEMPPGSEIRVAVRFSIAPGWKIYWSNPGEAGLPTTVALDAPEGFRVGELAYPAPQAFEGPGGVRSYGYSKEVLLSALVRAPDKIDATEVRFSVEATWLACEDTCRRGRQRLELVLPVTKSSLAAREVNQQLLAHHLSRLPVPLDHDACAVSADGNGAIIDCAGVHALELFPAADRKNVLTGQLSTESPRGARLRLSYARSATRRDTKLAPSRVRGVLRAELAGRNIYYSCDEDLRISLANVPRVAPTGAAAR